MKFELYLCSKIFHHIVRFNQIAGRLVTSFGENDNSSSSDPILKEVVGSDKLVAQLDDPINRETGYSNVLGSDSL